MDVCTGRSGDAVAQDEESDMDTDTDLDLSDEEDVPDLDDSFFTCTLTCVWMHLRSKCQLVCHLKLLTLAIFSGIVCLHVRERKNVSGW